MTTRIPSRIVTDGPTNTLEAPTSAVPALEERPAAPAVDRQEASRLLREARRMYGVAEMVQKKQVSVGVDSAVQAHRSLLLLFRLLLLLHGDSPPDAFPELAERAKNVFMSEGLLSESPDADIVAIDEMRRRFVDAAETTAAENRRYDRALARSAEWFTAVEEYLDRRLPGGESKLRRQMETAAGGIAIFAFGFLLGRHVHLDATHGSAPAPSAAGASATGPAFTATFFRSQKFAEPAFSRRDSSISFNWESGPPADGLPSDHFSVRWDGHLNVVDPMKYTFYVTSDDGSQLFVDGDLVVDNWGNHAPVTKTGTMELTKGSHRIRLDYYDDAGTAVVKLELSSERFARRLLTGEDLQ